VPETQQTRSPPLRYLKLRDGAAHWLSNGCHKMLQQSEILDAFRTLPGTKPLYARECNGFFSLMLY
jgi:hypothetical protein